MFQDKTKKSRNETMSATPLEEKASPVFESNSKAKKGT